MNNAIDRLIAELHEEEHRLLKQLKDHENDLAQAKRENHRVVDYFVKKELPDLETSTIRKLKKIAPDFEVPMVGFWFTRRIDPEVSLQALRIQFHVYLDDDSNIHPHEFQMLPGRLDGRISILQNGDIPKCSESIDQVRATIAKLEQLKMRSGSLSSEMQKRIERMLDASSKTDKKLRVHRIAESRAHGAGRKYSRIDSDDDFDLLEMWFWYELLSDDSDYSREYEEIERGYDGNDSEMEYAEGDSSNDSSGGGFAAGAAAGVAVGALASDTEAVPADNIDDHMEAGASDFS